MRLNRILLVTCLIAIITMGAVVAPPFTPPQTERVRLGWDTPVPTPDLATYVLYGSTNPGFSVALLSSATVKISMGTNRTTDLLNYASGRWVFAVTAIVGGAETPPSNFLVVDIRGGPRNLQRLP